MLTTNPSVPIYLHSEPIDMRKSFDGLFVIITHSELQCILSGVDLSSVRKRKRYVPPSTSVA
jgi:hypothetical protein